MHHMRLLYIQSTKGNSNELHKVTELHIWDEKQYANAYTEHVCVSVWEIEVLLEGEKKEIDKDRGLC